MPAKKVCLRAVMTNREGKRIWTGEYACSICGLRFRPDTTDPGKLSLDFSRHKDQHPTETAKQEDFNEAAFSVVQESRKDL
jgi:hypothetical protein